MELNNKNSFGIGEGELIEIIYELPLPMRLDRWLVSKRPEQSSKNSTFYKFRFSTCKL